MGFLGRVVWPGLLIAGVAALLVTSAQGGSELAFWICSIVIIIGFVGFTLSLLFTRPKEVVAARRRLDDEETGKAESRKPPQDS